MEGEGEKTVFSRPFWFLKLFLVFDFICRNVPDPGGQSNGGGVYACC